MLSRRTVPVLIGICLLSGMFLMGQDTWGPPEGPTITDIVPAEGYFDDEVAIWGTNFGADQGASTVTFNGLDAGVALSWSPQTIVINVPIGATSGPVVVTVGGLASNGFPFTVWPDCVEDADCDDGNECTDNICDPEIGTCSNPPLATGTPCDDGNPCTVGDICQDGSCTAGPCAAMGPLDPCCGDPACVGQVICEPAECSTDADCDDGNECTTGTCSYPAGICSYQPEPDGMPCDNGNACTIMDTCQAGVCVGGPALVCDDLNICTDNTCDPTEGCVFVNNTAPCDDGNACTTDDTCSDGACVGGPPLDCDDGNACTDDSCDAALGCLYLCNATGASDPCCTDPACLGNPVCITGPMAQIPAGCFMMGDHLDGMSWALPVHNVCISAFEMDVYKVTNARYAACVAAGGCTAPYYSWSSTRPSYYGDPAYDDFPVIYVDWYQATDYCTWAGKRLPTEAEWEYAARGGLAGKRYPWGDTISGTDANYYNSGDRWDNDTSPVGHYAPNGYGLYDMAGNVWEWVNDGYSSTYYQYCVDNGIINDPPGPVSGTSRVLRGGSWYYSTSSLRAALRGSYFPDLRYSDIGFRCSR